MKKYVNTAPKVVVVGSINYDLFSYVQDFPKRHETIHANRSIGCLGGKGLNQAIAAAKAGADVVFICCAGDDHHADLAYQFLIEHNIHTDFFFRSDTINTGTASILVAKNGDNMIAAARGANAELTPDHIGSTEDIIKTGDVMLVQMEVPFDTVAYALKLAKKHGLTTILNPAPASVDIIKLLDDVDILTPNETETKVLTGLYPSDAKNCRAASGILQGYGAKNIVITRGEEGCFFSSSGDVHQIAPFNVKPVDTTGAGDVFNGYSATQIARGKTLPSVMREACAAAAISITKETAQGVAPTSDEVAQFILQQRIT